MMYSENYVVYLYVKNKVDWFKIKTNVKPSKEMLLRWKKVHTVPHGVGEGCPPGVTIPHRVEEGRPKTELL